MSTIPSFQQCSTVHKAYKFFLLKTYSNLVMSFPTTTILFQASQSLQDSCNNLLNHFHTSYVTLVQCVFHLVHTQAECFEYHLHQF